MLGAYAGCAALQIIARRAFAISPPREVSEDTLLSSSSQRDFVRWIWERSRRLVPDSLRG